MKVSKAIEILTKYQKDYLTRLEPDFDTAIKLGIEALKSHQRALKGFTHPEKYLLPGETLEKEGK